MKQLCVPGTCLHCLPSRWNDFQDEHDEVLEQLESFRTTFALSNTTTTTNNSRSSSPRPIGMNGVTEVQGAKPSTPVRGGGEGGGASEDASNIVRPISGREGRSSRSSNAPPRPASGRSIVARTSSSISYEDGGLGDGGNRSRNHSWGSTVKSPREDGLNKPGSNPSSRRSSPRRPPSSSSSVPSPRYCSSPRTSGSAATSTAPDASGLRRRQTKEEWAGGEGWERGRGGCDEDGNNEEETQGPRRGDSDDHAIGTVATATTAVAENRIGLLHGGGSGGYEDDFDDCFEEDSEEGGQQKEQDALPVRGSSGGGVPDQTAYLRNMPLIEVVYRPPSGGSRGKGERPKSAARQGRSASLNGAG